MRVFVDTSAFYALIVPEDAHHAAALACFEQLSRSQAVLQTSNYVLLECASLMQRRHGFEPARTFLTKTSSTVDVIWVGSREHQEAVALWTKAGSRKLSLVDCSSVAVMRQHALQHVVAFDAHFIQVGFTMLPQADRVAERRASYRVRTRR